MSEPLAEELAAAGGVAAPPQATARLRHLLSDALRYGRPSSAASARARASAP